MPSSIQNIINMKVDRLYLHQQDNFENKEHINELRQYPLHIYLICKAQKIKYDAGRTQITPETITHNFYTELGGIREDIFIPMLNDLGITKITSDYPFNLLTTFNSNGDVIFESKANLLLAILSSQSGNYYEALNQEVLYVGQAFGKDGSRITIDRLKTHEKAQKIYFDIQSKFPDYEIWFLSMSFNELRITMFKPWGDKIDKSKFFEELAQHEMVASTAISMDQKITITEACLIKYFNTYQYNKEYLNFPSPEHSTYDECYKLDFASAAFELTSHSVNLKLFSQDVAPSFVHYKSYYLHSDPDRQEMLKWFSQ